MEFIHKAIVADPNIPIQIEPSKQIAELALKRALA